MGYTPRSAATTDGFWGTIHRSDIGSREQELEETIEDQETKKEQIFEALFGFPLRRGDKYPDLFSQVDFVYRRGEKSVQRMKYNGKDIYHFVKGEKQKYSDNRNSYERKIFDERLERERAWYENSP